MSRSKPTRATPPGATKPAPAAPAVMNVAPIAMRRDREAAAETFLAFGQSALTSFSESQAAIARGIEALALEMTGLARSGIVSAGESATALLGTKNLADAIEVQIAFARRNMEAIFGGSVKLTEIGVRLASEASRPILSRLGDPAKALFS